MRRPGRHARGTVRITTAQATLARQALDDARTYRIGRASGWCANCVHHPAGACDDHVADLDQADAYRDLAVELGEEGDR